MKGRVCPDCAHTSSWAINMPVVLTLCEVMCMNCVWNLITGIKQPSLRRMTPRQMPRFHWGLDLVDLPLFVFPSQKKKKKKKVSTFAIKAFFKKMHFYMLCWWIVSTVCVHMQLTDLQVEWTSLLLVSQFRGTCHRGISIRIDGSAVAAHGRQFYPLQHCSQHGLSSHRAVVLLKVFWAVLFVFFYSESVFFQASQVHL